MKSYYKYLHHELFIPVPLCQRLYEFLQLANGMVVLLISDPSSSTSAASLSVASGACLDGEVQGLAHLCEHAVFLGSKKYPQPNSLQKLVRASNEGLINAYTTGETTCFYYQMCLPNNRFEEFGESLDILADSVSEPIFSGEYLRKEILAVDNEHVRNMLNISKVLFHATRLLSSADPANRFRQFATGSFGTLAKIPINVLRTKLRKYFLLNYIPEHFALVVKGPQSLNILRKLVFSSFGQLEGRPTSLKSELDQFSILRNRFNPMKPFDKANINKCALLKKVKRKEPNILRMMFPIDMLSSHNARQDSLFTEAFIDLVNSRYFQVSDILLQNKYITSLESFVSEINQGTSCLILQMKLTEKGSFEMKTVLGTFFQALSSLFPWPKQTEDVESVAQFLSDTFSISQLNFLYSDPTNAMDEVSEYAETLQHDISTIGSRWILQGSPSWSDLEGFFGFSGESEEASLWWKKQALEFLEFVWRYININNFNIIYYGDVGIVDKEILRFNDGYQKDPYFLFDYSIVELKINSIKTEFEANMRFNENLFIPSLAKRYLELFHKFEEAFRVSHNMLLGFKNNKKALLQSKPEIIENTKFKQVWLKKEYELKYTGALLVSFDLLCTQIIPSAKETVLNETLCEYIKNELEVHLADSVVLGYTWNIMTSSKSDLRLTITVGGHSDKVGLIIDMILDTIASLKIRKDAFQEAKERLEEFYSNLSQQSALELASMAAVVLLEENTVGLDERIESLASISLDELKSFVKYFQKDLTSHVLVQGDVLEKLALQIVSRIDAFVGGLFTKSPPFTTKTIKPGLNLCYKAVSPDSMSSIVYFLQLGQKLDPQIRVLARLVGFYIEKECLTELRTKKQMGYAILTGLRIYRGSLGVHISILSGDFSPEELEFEIDNYIDTLDEKLSSMSQKEFEEEILFPFMRKFVSNPQDISDLRGETFKSSDPFEDMSTSLMYKTGGDLKNLDTEIGRSHMKIWNEIISTTYRFETFKQGLYSPNKWSFEIDLDFLKNCKKSDFSKIWDEKVSLYSPMISKLSIWMERKEHSNEELDEDFVDGMASQIEVFLKQHRISIDRHDLVDIIVNKGGNQGLIMKEVIRTLQKNGEKRKVLQMVLRNGVQMVNNGLKSKLSLKRQKPKDYRSRIVSMRFVEKVGDDLVTHQRTHNSKRNGIVW